MYIPTIYMKDDRLYRDHDHIRTHRHAGPSTRHYCTRRCNNRAAQFLSLIPYYAHLRMAISYSL